MKTCGKCGEEKPLSEFYKRGGKREDYQASCKDCSCKLARAWFHDNINRAYEYARTSPKKRRVNHRGGLKTKGVRAHDIENALDRWESATVCDLCGKPFNGEKKCIDHDHNTGAFRGIVHNHCNSGLGFFKDSPELMLNAISYLMKHRAVATSAPSDDPYSLFDAVSNSDASQNNSQFTT